VGFVAGVREQTVQLIVGDPATAHLITERSKNVSNGRFPAEVSGK
jgi:hypothetical protein